MGLDNISEFPSPEKFKLSKEIIDSDINYRCQLFDLLVGAFTTIHPEIKDPDEWGRWMEARNEIIKYMSFVGNANERLKKLGENSE